MNNILSKYRDRLVNIRRNNKTINLNKLTKKFFDLSELCEHYFDESTLVNNTILCKKYNLFKVQTFKKPSEENLKRRDIEEKIYNRLRKIDQEADLIKRTSGMHVEYIGYPFIEGKIDGITIRAPLLLFPVDLIPDRKTQTITLIPQIDMGIQFNKSLVFAIEKYLNRTIDEDDQNEIINIIINNDIDLNQRISEIIKILSKNIPIKDELPKSSIEKFTNDLNDENIFEIKNYMILGIFVQFSNAIAKDYDKLMKLDDLGLINYLLNGDSDYENYEIDIDSISENEKYFISDIDPSQEASVLSIVNSNNKGIVIHGPPGTGKSQTIVNLISQFVKDRKKVLMVCQKKTALDVVKNRLDAVGIKNAVLVEDYERDRNYALKEMERIIGSCDIINNNFNGKELWKINKQIDEKIQELNKLKEVLGKKYQCGLSLFELYSKNKDKHNIIRDSDIMAILLKYKYDEIVDLLDKLEDLVPYAKYDNNIMKLRKNWKDLSYMDKEKIEESLKQLIELNKTIEEYSQYGMTYSIENVYSNIDDIKKLTELITDFEINYVMSCQELDVLKHMATSILNLNLPSNISISTNELIDYEKNPLKIKKQWNQLTIDDKNKIKEIIEGIFNCKPKLDEHYNHRYNGTYILNNKDTLKKFLELLETTEITESIPKAKIPELENQLLKIRKLNIPNDADIPYANLKDNEYHLMNYCKFMEKNAIVRMISKLFNSEIKKSQLIVEELEKISNMGYIELYNTYLSLKYLDSFFKDIPNSFTKEIFNNWINKKTNQLLLWKMYYNLESTILSLEFNESSKKEIMTEISNMLNYGMYYEKYINYKNKFLEYFEYDDIPEDNELHELLQKVDKFEKIKEYELLKNSVDNWHVFLNLLNNEFFNMDVPEKITPNTINEWITKKMKYLQLWEIYYKLESKYTLPELNNKNKDKLLQKLNILREYGELYPKYMQSLNTLSNYLQDVKDLKNKELEEIINHLDEFDNIRYYDTLKSDIDKEGLYLLKYLNKYSKNELMNTYYYSWIDNIERNPEVFKTVKNIDNYESIKKDLSELYNRKFQETKKYINWILNNIEICKEAKRKIPYEANKKRRRKPLKEILELYEEDVLNIIPIWLTTPDVVSAIFPLKKEMFDVVIYDEASQMPMEYTLPSLYRAKRFVVAGDEKQLPPTDFFRVSFDEDDDEIDGMDELEVKSLLELCKTRCPTVLLSFHYRAKYEEIINFSNYAYYDGKIVISPNKHRGKPFEFIKVNGRWENRKNHVEAKKVVEKVYELLKENSEKSIGIITFNSEHRDLIIDELERKALEDDEFRKLYEKSLNLKKDNEDMSLFVRNIENVQGDERDIIIFSTAYAKDKDGKLRYNFGPLNRMGGENRLNVAITRAKEKVIIITSIEPEELKVENLKNEGPKLLKKYMQYVKFISNGDYANAEIILNSLCDAEKLNELQFDSPFEEEIYDELTKRGYIVHTQVGCSKYRIDLAIKHPKEDKYILGIECDGATYHSSRSAKERDLYRQRFLEMKGWKIIRIWSRNWWRNREKEILRIEKEINNILNT